MNINFAKIVDEVKELDSESKEYLIDLTKKLLIEEKRRDIKRHSEESIKEYEEGKIHFGSMKDMKKELYED